MVTLLIEFCCIVDYYYTMVAQFTREKWSAKWKYGSEYYQRDKRPIRSQYMLYTRVVRRAITMSCDTLENISKDVLEILKITLQFQLHASEPFCDGVLLWQWPYYLYIYLYYAVISICIIRWYLFVLCIYYKYEELMYGLSH